MQRNVGVMTDAHADLPALDVALAVMRVEDCDAVYHTGDAVAVGPDSAECLDRLLHTPNARPVVRNHDAWIAFGLPRPHPPG